MNRVITSDKRKAVSQLALAAAAVASALLLPQVFHAIGSLLGGNGALTGAAFLPMQIPVLLAGFLGGPVVGLMVGILSPILSYCISGMPTAAVAPFMVVELAVYGLTAGLLARTKANRFAQLLIAQFAGRAARALAVFLALILTGEGISDGTVIFAFVSQGLCGVLLQWALIPLLCPRFEKLVNKLYD